jgi:hypothetical protein
MDDAVAVTLERVAIRVRRLGIAAPARVFLIDGIRGEHKRSVAACSYDH